MYNFNYRYVWLCEGFHLNVKKQVSVVKVCINVMDNNNY